MQIVLTVVDGPQKGKRFEFSEPDIFLLGRDNEGSKAHFRLNNDDTQVSRNHFLLEINPPDCFIRDAGSLNGTFVNRPAGKHIFYLLGRKADTAEYSDRASRLKDKLGYSAIQKIEERIKLEGNDEIHVGSTTILVEMVTPKPQPAGCRAVEDSVNQCIECGREMPNSAQMKKPELLCVDDFICGHCRSRHLQSRRPVFEVRCYKCGCDVTSMADADGKADELKHIALYLCSSCADKSITNPLPVKQIKDYRLITSLGEGGFGIVFLAQHENTGRAVALKVTKEAIKQSPALIKRFKREVAIMQKLQHPNLVRLYDEGIGDFGLAKNYLVHGGTFTAVNEWLGTVVYCPPEQIHDFKHSAPVTDIYSMGIAFYNSVTGVFPYDFPTKKERADLMRRGLRPRDPISFILEDDQPIPIEKRLPEIDRDLARFINAAIDKDSNKRPSSAQNFMRALIV